MAATGSSLVLGFYGEGSVHRDNTRALLTDFIKAYHHTNKGAKVYFVFAAEPFTDTMADLADFALTSGYRVGLVGHAASYQDPNVQTFVHDAEGALQVLSEHTSLPQGIVDFIGAWQSIGAVRLMLLADPAVDDNAYIAVDVAMGKNIPVRSMLNGLDLVTVKPDNEEEEHAEMARRHAEEEEEFEGEEEEEPEDDEEEYYDDEAEGDDEEVDDEPDEEEGDEDEDLEEPEDDEEGDDEEEEEADDEESEEDDTDDGEEEEEEEADLDDDDADEEDEDDADDGDEEEEEDVAPAPKKRTRRAAAAAEVEVPLTVTALTRYAERDRDGFYELAAEYDVHKGRGMKISMMVERVLAAAGKPVKKAARPAAPAAKKAPAKKAAATKKAAPRRAAPAAAAPAKKASAPTKKAPARTTGTSGTATVKSPSAPIRKAAIKAMGALLDLLEEV